MKRTFQDTWKLGDAGKRLVMNYFSACGYQVKDLTSQQEFNSQFIDFSLSDEKCTRYVCVRTDTRIASTQNIVLETLMCRRNSHRLVPGWLFTCKAQLLAYLDAYWGHLYLLDWGLLKDMANHSQIGYRKTFRNPIDKNSIGQVHIIPISDIVNCAAFKGKVTIDVQSLRQYNWERPAPF